MTEDPVSTLLRYAAAMYGQADGGPAEQAQKRGWVDAEGRITKAGSELVEALAEQKGTRSAFRLG
ncbi:MAG: hypothetical protein GC152_13170 [Alphaproteobacteria bacterium]|nr:hypothetical protein [Alphaproteobacteria bacterium]